MKRRTRPLDSAEMQSVDATSWMDVELLTDSEDYILRWPDAALSKLMRKHLDINTAAVARSSKSTSQSAAANVVHTPTVMMSSTTVTFNTGETPSKQQNVAGTSSSSAKRSSTEQHSGSNVSFFSNSGGTNITFPLDLTPKNPIKIKQADHAPFEPIFVLPVAWMRHIASKHYGLEFTKQTVNEAEHQQAEQQTSLQCEGQPQEQAHHSGKGNLVLPRGTVATSGANGVDEDKPIEESAPLQQAQEEREIIDVDDEDNVRNSADKVLEGAANLQDAEEADEEKDIDPSSVFTPELRSGCEAFIVALERLVTTHVRNSSARMRQVISLEATMRREASALFGVEYNSPPLAAGGKKGGPLALSMSTLHTVSAVPMAVRLTLFDWWVKQRSITSSPERPWGQPLIASFHEPIPGSTTEEYFQSNLEPTSPTQKPASFSRSQGSSSALMRRGIRDTQNIWNRLPVHSTLFEEGSPVMSSTAQGAKQLNMDALPPLAEVSLRKVNWAINDITAAIEDCDSWFDSV